MNGENLLTDVYLLIVKKESMSYFAIDTLFAVSMRAKAVFHANILKTIYEKTDSLSSFGALQYIHF